MALVPAKSVGPTAAQISATNPQVDPRRDYELALQLGTQTAWTSFLNAHPGGFYADLARGQLEKSLAAAEGVISDKSVKATNANDKSAGKAASLTLTDPVTLKVEPAGELFACCRASCTVLGATPGRWTVTGIRRVQILLNLFNKNAGTKLDVKVANLDALDAVRSKPSRICPLTCEHGYKADGEICTKITCRAGYEVGDDNTCERLEMKKPTGDRAPPFKCKVATYRIRGGGRHARSIWSNSMQSRRLSTSHKRLQPSKIPIWQQCQRDLQLIH